MKEQVARDRQGSIERIIRPTMPEDGPPDLALEQTVEHLRSCHHLSYDCGPGGGPIPAPLPNRPSRAVPERPGGYLTYAHCEGSVWAKATRSAMSSRLHPSRSPEGIGAPGWPKAAVWMKSQAL